MPELPEVETVRRGLAPHMEGRVIRSVQLARADLRFPFPTNFETQLTGSKPVAARQVSSRRYSARRDRGALMVEPSRYERPISGDVRQY